MKAWFYTNMGPSRLENQDGVYLAGKSFTDMDEPAMLSFAGESGLFAVVDGMGGMGGGGAARDVVLRELPGLRSPERLEEELAAISRAIRQESGRQPEFAHMGATIAGLWLKGGAAWAFNCGDCRVYQARSGYLQKLTHDHSFVQELVDSGSLEEWEMRFHPRKNIVTSALDVDDLDPAVYEREIRVQPGAVFLICSDGLWEALSTEEMEACLAASIETAAERLVAGAKQAKAKDNFSFILLDVGAGDEQP